MTLTKIASTGVEDSLRWVLGANGTSDYTFTGPGLTGTVNDPTIYLTRGHTYIFQNNNTAGAHPFYIKTSIANGGTNDAYNTGVTNNGGAGGTEITFTVPHDSPDILYYQCSSHASMYGQFNIAGSVADGSISTAKIADDAVNNDKLANSVVAEIAANTAKTSNATHTGDVTGSTSLTIANNAVTTAKIADEAVTLAKLEHGTSSNNGKFLRANNGADPSFETVTTTAINNNADNRVITGSGTADTLNAESNLTYDGNNIDLAIDNSGEGLRITASGDNYSLLKFDSNVSSAGGSLSNIQGHWNGTEVANIIFAAGDDTTNKDDGIIKFTTTPSGGSSTERLRIDSSGKISTGNESAPDVGDGGLCIQKNTDGNKAITVKNTNVAHGVTTYDETDTYFSLGQSSGNKGGVEIRGYTDTASADPGIRLRGIIASDSDHTYTPLVFVGAEANGTSVQNIAADRRIATFQNSDGARIVNITGSGITFGDNYAANFALDSYEEGTYTPVIRGHQGWSASHSEQHGNYVKIGGMCYVSIRIETSSMSAISGTSYLECSLPFNSATISGHTVGTLMCSEWSIADQNISWMGGNVMSNSQYIRMHYHNGNNNNTNQMTKGNVNNDLHFRGTVVYRVP